MAKTFTFGNYEAKKLTDYYTRRIKFLSQIDALLNHYSETHEPFSIYKIGKAIYGDEYDTNKYNYCDDHHNCHSMTGIIYNFICMYINTDNNSNYSESRPIHIMTDVAAPSASPIYYIP